MIFQQKFWNNITYLQYVRKGWSHDQKITAIRIRGQLTHEVHDQFTHAGSEDEVPHEVGDEGEGDADDWQYQVAGGQRQQEEVGDGPHALVPHQDGDDEAVAQDAE